MEFFLPSEVFYSFLCPQGIRKRFQIPGGNLGGEFEKLMGWIQVLTMCYSTLLRHPVDNLVSSEFAVAMAYAALRCIALNCVVLHCFALCCLTNTDI